MSLQKIWCIDIYFLIGKGSCWTCKKKVTKLSSYAVFYINYYNLVHHTVIKLFTFKINTYVLIYVIVFHYNLQTWLHNCKCSPQVTFCENIDLTDILVTLIPYMFVSLYKSLLQIYCFSVSGTSFFLCSHICIWNNVCQFRYKSDAQLIFFYT